MAIFNRAKAKALDRMFYVFGALMVSLALMGVDIGVVLLLVAAYLFVAGCMVVLYVQVSEGDVRLSNGVFPTKNIPRRMPQDVFYGSGRYSLQHSSMMLSTMRTCAGVNLRSLSASSRRSLSMMSPVSR